ncbi:MAG: hypothetical protein E4H17_03395 [Gemmatimonadales bacterium]|nr:MAG: hypothetical protein E4H17_03395 [Gemmatimonadales bacterium]
MKRIAVLVMVGLLVFAADIFALKSTPDFGIGAELTSTNFNTVGVMATIHIPGVPLFIGLGANFVEGLSGGTEMTTTVDYWLLHNNIGTGYFSWYFGLGGYGVLGFNPTWTAFGVRVPIGLQIWPLNNEKLEVFLELAPAWVPLYGGAFDPGKFQAQVALGFRLWYDVAKAK